MNTDSTKAMTRRRIAGLIDHALLAPTLTDAQTLESCRQACLAGVAGICVKPYAVSMCRDIVAGHATQLGSVVGFPHGSSSLAVKAFETERAIEDGAVEIDAVVNYPKVLSGDWSYVGADIRAVLDVAHAAKAIVKIIFETCYLDRQQKVRLCRLCSELGVDFVKTSTGFATGGATVDDVRLMRQECPPSVRIKASGGIRTLRDLEALRDAGADRIGCSQTFEILAEVG